MATINGTANGEHLDGGAASDVIFGFGGNDIITGGAGIDTMWGGDADDRLTGAVEADALYGEAGNDTIRTGGGVDSIDGGDGDDRVEITDATTLTNGQLFGGAGLDELVAIETVNLIGGFSAANGFERLRYVDFLTRLVGDANANVIDLSGFEVELEDAGGMARVEGGDGDDRLTGSAVSDSLRGGLGDDILKGGDGDDLLIGDGGSNTLIGGDGADELSLISSAGGSADGGGGNDSLRGGLGPTLLTGGSGADVLEARGDGNSLNGGAGDDKLDIFNATTVAQLIGGAGFDFIFMSHNDGLAMNEFSAAATGIEQISFSVGTTGYITTTDGDDDFDFSGIAMVGGAPDLAAGNGNDRVVGSGEGEEILGQAGADTLNGGGGHDTLVGGAGMDLLSGGGGNDSLSGGLHADRLFAVDGSDTLDGGGGADLMTAGLGADRFVYRTAFDSVAGSMDRIIDFDLAVDRIDLSPVDADVYTDGDQAAVVVSAFSETAGELILSYNAAKGWTKVMLDVSGDAVADLVIRVDGEITAGGLIL